MRKKMISLMMTVAMGTVMISGATVVKADSDEMRKKQTSRHQPRKE